MIKGIKIKKRKMNYELIILLIALILLSVFSLTIGVKDFNLMGLISGNYEDLYLTIESRLPRLLSILITGAGLSIAGLIMQTITNNKFVSPSTAGMMDWAKFGITIAIVFFGNESILIKMLVAFVFTILGTLLFMKIITRLNFQNAVLVPLIGMMLGSVVSSVSTFISYKFDIIQNVSSWMEGNFSLIIRGSYELLYLGVPFLILSFFYANKFTIAGMGKSFATNLGLNHQKVILIGLLIVAFITSSIVVTIGSIPFIGLIIPNLVSMYRGDNVKNTLIETALLGSFFVLLCDILGRIIIFPYEISISIIFSIVGSFIFLILVFRGNLNASKK